MCPTLVRSLAVNAWLHVQSKYIPIMPSPNIAFQNPVFNRQKEDIFSMPCF